jgi:glycosyltransferase involved in cell wall biosynthesis
VLEDALDQMLATEPYDVVHFEFSHMAVYRGERAPDRPRVGGHRRRPVFLLDEHNIEYDIVRQTARAGGSAVRRLFSEIDWRKVYAEERWAWTRLDGCTLTSAGDQSTLRRHAPQVPTAVVPNGVDLDFFRPRAGAAPREPSTLLFFGAVDYYPNTEGLLFFLNEVWPRLSARIPRVRLCIVGRRPPASVLAHRGPDVEITGMVDDIRPYVERAAAVIVPLRIGGGTRLKILEAMAMGKAVVSTSLGAEGLDVVPGRDLLIADDAEGFAARCAELLDDPGRSDRIGAAARRVVETRYGWGASVERLSAFYGEVLEARGAA